MAPANVTLNFISIFQMISKFLLTFLLIKGLLFRSLSQTRREPCLHVLWNVLTQSDV